MVKVERDSRSGEKKKKSEERTEMGLEGKKKKINDGNLEAQRGEKSWEIRNFPPAVVPSSESSFWLRVWPCGDTPLLPLKPLVLLTPSVSFAIAI